MRLMLLTLMLKNHHMEYILFMLHCCYTDCLHNGFNSACLIFANIKKGKQNLGKSAKVGLVWT